MATVFQQQKKKSTNICFADSLQQTHKKNPEGWLSWMSPDCLLQHGIRLSNFQVQISAPQIDISWTVHHIVYEQPREQTHFFIANSVPIAPAQRIRPLKMAYADLTF